ncbi:unnamed protein product (macronuclear) [Paramecium tetraurelia]|uniref:Uncharacterized protein n=1 Tax=Paramecium tetraurelia TaxID=5888 RepID=A0C262_PARTE|nr:uncharacterized protein GSPATT00034356001 [Paramecium tetraurelia]CAK64879.1 unnamed protein product [Paramecium tetraurelia]|eukprot:XP_001432276.1 hypothetical protein (macronuclear) [Paramecium tetraurelia strain d4-2]
MWNFQMFIWVLSNIPFSQEISDNINIYNELENRQLEGIWTLQDENQEIDVLQLQGIVKFSNNSIIYKGFSHYDKQEEYFFGEIFLYNVRLFQMQYLHCIKGNGQVLETLIHKDKILQLGTNVKMNILFQYSQIIILNKE